MSEKKNSREHYIERSADILCKAAYRLCVDTFKTKKGDKKPTADAKLLKDTCSAVKETLAISESLNKKTDLCEELRIILDSESEDLAI